MRACQFTAFSFFQEETAAKTCLIHVLFCSICRSWKNVTCFYQLRSRLDERFLNRNARLLWSLSLVWMTINGINVYCSETEGSLWFYFCCFEMKGKAKCAFMASYSIRNYVKKGAEIPVTHLTDATPKTFRNMRNSILLETCIIRQFKWNPQMFHVCLLWVFIYSIPEGTLIECRSFW